MSKVTVFEIVGRMGLAGHGEGLVDSIYEPFNLSRDVWMGSEWKSVGSTL